MGKKSNIEMAGLDKLGEEAVLNMRAEGQSVRKLCLTLGIGNRALYGWLGNDRRPKAMDGEGRTRRDRWKEASVLGAEAYAGRSEERLEALIEPETGRMKTSVTREEVALLKAQAESDRWQAGNMDPETFRQNLAPNVLVQQLSVGDLHLQAVRQLGGGAKREQGIIVAEQAGPGIAGDEDDSPFGYLAAGQE